jgi:NAD(P)-dependent dehydrogenase (short-subunit alcohol dehydrogenase family)
MTIDHIVPPREQGLPERGFLTGRCALITGAARRIGRALAVAVAGQGADVVIHYRGSQAEADETAGLVRERGASAALVQGDLASVEVCTGLIGRAAEAVGRPIDILVNNASVFADGQALETTSEQWDRNQAVNLRAPFLLGQALARQLPPDGSADIVNLNDFRAVNPGCDHFAYTVSKVGLHGLTRSLALALAPRVRVNELALGAVLPPEKAPDQYMHTLRSEIPTGRFPRVAEVAHALLFLLGNGAVTGQTIFVDGGRHLAGGVPAPGAGRETGGGDR